MKTIRELVELTSDFLVKKGVSSARREAEDLLAFCLKKKRLDLYLDYDKPVEDSEIDRYREMVAKKGQRMPFEYIVGSTSFLGLDLKVNQDVLIPRKETEVCLDQIFKEHDFSNKHVWDVATGSGCIGLACKNHFPSASVTLSDISKQALQVASYNAKACGLEVELKQGDLLEPFKGEKVDVVFCNPPYISEKAFDGLEPEVKCFEPKSALVAPDQGLSCYKRLVESIPAYLNSGGYLFLEIGFDQKDPVSALFDSNVWSSVTCIQDFAGHDRFISACFF